MPNSTCSCPPQVETEVAGVLRVAAKLGTDNPVRRWLEAQAAELRATAD